MTSILLCGRLPIALYNGSCCLYRLFFPREHFNLARVNNINHIAHIIIIGLDLFLIDF